MLETEPRDLLLYKNDLVITDDLQWSRGIDGVIQECRIKLQMFEGEWFLNLKVGRPHYNGILGAKPDLAAIVAGHDFTAALLTVEDVTDVTLMDISIIRSTRQMVVKWQVRCVFGTTPVDTLTI